MRRMLVVLAAATNTCLIRRRNNNALCNECPLQHDTQRTVSDIHKLMCDTATAMYECARRQEDDIYTHYEGWLPKEADLPTTQWKNAWSDLVTLGKPCRLKQSPTPDSPGISPDPVIRPDSPETVARQLLRSTDA